MPQLEVSAIVDADPETAFAVAHGVGDERAEWDPGVERRFFIRGAHAVEPGTHVFTKAPDGRRFILEYTAVHPGQSSGAVMVKGPWFLASFGEGWRFSPLADGRTKATWKVTYRVRSAIAAGALGAAVRPLFELELKARIRALEAACRR